MSPIHDHAARFRDLPLRTMAINVALTALIFVTQKSWDAWVLERKVPEDDRPMCSVEIWPWYAEVAPGGESCRLIETTRVHLLDVATGRIVFEHDYGR